MGFQGAANLLPGFGGPSGKVYPQHMAGGATRPVVGNVFYVDAVAGSDTANPGTSENNAFKTLYAAHLAATTNNYDVINIAPGGTGTGTGTNESVYGAYSFSKSLITVVGAPSPIPLSQRSRILWNTAGQSVLSAPLLTISGSGNTFVNLQFGTFVDNNVLIENTGSRNAYYGVHFAGIGDDTAGDDTAARCLWIAGGGENYFNGCTIGLDTVACSTTNAQLELSGATTRNVFEDCKFICFVDSATHLMVTAGASAIDRFVEFKNCLFHNAIKSTSTNMTVMMSLNAAVGGSVLLTGMTQTFGATDWADNFANVAVGGPVPTANTSNFLIGAS